MFNLLLHLCFKVLWAQRHIVYLIGCLALAFAADLDHIAIIQSAIVLELVGCGSEALSAPLSKHELAQCSHKLTLNVTHRDVVVALLGFNVVLRI